MHGRSFAGCWLGHSWVFVPAVLETSWSANLRRPKLLSGPGALYALFFCRGTLQLNRINEYKWIAALVFAQRFSSGTKEPCTPKWQLTTQNSHSSSLQEIVAFFPLDLSKNPRRWVLAHFFPLASHDNFLGAVPSLYVFVCSLLVVLITSDGWFSEAFCLQFLAMFHCRWCLREYTQPFKTS